MKILTEREGKDLNINWKVICRRERDGKRFVNQKVKQYITKNDSIEFIKGDLPSYFKSEYNINENTETIVLRGDKGIEFINMLSPRDKADKFFSKILLTPFEEKNVSLGGRTIKVDHIFDNYIYFTNEGIIKYDKYGNIVNEINLSDSVFFHNFFPKSDPEKFSILKSYFIPAEIEVVHEREENIYGVQIFSRSIEMRDISNAEINPYRETYNFDYLAFKLCKAKKEDQKKNIDCSSRSRNGNFITLASSSMIYLFHKDSMVGSYGSDRLRKVFADSSRYFTPKCFVVKKQNYIFGYKNKFIYSLKSKRKIPLDFLSEGFVIFKVTVSDDYIFAYWMDMESNEKHLTYLDENFKPIKDYYFKPDDDLLYYFIEDGIANEFIFIGDDAFLKKIKCKERIF
ncbi:MAG: hypothetical protein CR982_02840 [Candidatus Cloacimonadota bacterium]|nr:MAG: hypothetical protein CR982_02840 [Candidatus Cloacimonadota bacterium]PIE79206.1 MAG: hypothetical protein CSA15_04035 [Candidatus Delongbacteria bacterium]